MASLCAGIAFLAAHMAMLVKAGRTKAMQINAMQINARRGELMLQAERERHDLEVKASMGIVRYAATMPEFLADAESRLDSLSQALARAHSRPEDSPAGLSAALARDLHTLHGTASTYGFEAFARLAREAEMALDDIRDPQGLDSRDWSALAPFPERLRAALEKIRALAQDLTGLGSAAALPIAGQRLRELHRLARAAEADPLSAMAPWSELLLACRSLDHRRLDGLAGKYGDLIRTLAGLLGKRVDFRAQPASLELSPRVFAALDEPLVHLLRNAADHGIEGEALRLLHGKPACGIIDLKVAIDGERWEITVSDDGRGLDEECLARNALKLGLVEAGALAAMSGSERRNLAFLPGLSSRDEATGISGMGVGMDAVATWARQAGGRVSLASSAGQGMAITLHLPRGPLAAKN